MSPLSVVEIRPVVIPYAPGVWANKRGGTRSPTRRPRCRVFAAPPAPVVGQRGLRTDVSGVPDSAKFRADIPLNCEDAHAVCGNGHWVDRRPSLRSPGEGSLAGRMLAWVTSWAARVPGGCRRRSVAGPLASARERRSRPGMADVRAVHQGPARHDARRQRRPARRQGCRAHIWRAAPGRRPGHRDDRGRCDDGGRGVQTARAAGGDRHRGRVLRHAGGHRGGARDLVLLVGVHRGCAAPRRGSVEPEGQARRRECGAGTTRHHTY